MIDAATCGCLLSSGWAATPQAQPVFADRPLIALVGPEDRDQDNTERGDRPTSEQRPAASKNRPTDPQDGADPPQPVTPIPPITDADRAAAFPDVEAREMQDDTIHFFVLLEQLEWQRGDASGVAWDSTGWVGGDLERLWFRTEGDAEHGRHGSAEAHLFYGRAFARWWDVVIGLRQDLRPARQQTWLAVGLQGLAPYWFEVETTVYLGAGGQTAARFEAEYELLITNRLVLQPRAAVDLYGKSDLERGIGAGFNSFEGGLRVRYQFRREFAPYVGVKWTETFADTTRFREIYGETTSGHRFVAGLRLWF